MIVKSIKIDGVKRVLQARMGKILRKATSDLRAMQLEQIANAFNNSGQPSAKWKPLWADTFKGNVAQKNLEALGEAHTGLFKSIQAFRKGSL